MQNLAQILEWKLNFLHHLQQAYNKKVTRAVTNQQTKYTVPNIKMHVDIGVHFGACSVPRCLSPLTIDANQEHIEN